MTTRTDGVTTISKMSSRGNATKAFSIKGPALYSPLKVDWAYLAGFFDGEGCMSAIRQQRKGYQYYQIRFVLSNTEFGLLKELRDLFGGSIHVSSIKKKEHWKQVYMWHMESGKLCLYVMTHMLPYLRYKVREVELAIEFFDEMEPTKPGQRISQKEMERRIRIVQQMRSIPGRRSGARTILAELPKEVVDFRRECRRCGKVFERDTTMTAYCSMECRTTGRKEQYRLYMEKRRKPRPEIKPPVVQCAASDCRKKFYKLHWKAKFCSKRCAHRINARDYRGRFRNLKPED